MRCRHRSTASIVFSSAKYASRDIPATCRAMRSQFSTMSPSRSRSLLEGKDLVSLGFGGNAGAEAIFADEVYRPADPVLELLLDAAVCENAADHGRIHLDEDVDVTVRLVLAARHRAEYRSMNNAHAFKVRPMRPKRPQDTADQGLFLWFGLDSGHVASQVTLHDRLDVIRERAALPLCPSPSRDEHAFGKTDRNNPSHQNRRSIIHCNTPGRWSNRL